MATGKQIQKKGSSHFTPTPVTGMFKPRPFAEPVQPETATPEVQTKVELGNIEGDRLAGMQISAPAPIQAKLTIGAPGDKYEQEADTIAETVMRMPAISAPAPVENPTAPSPFAQAKPISAAIFAQAKPISAAIFAQAKPISAAITPVEPVIQMQPQPSESLSEEAGENKKGFIQRRIKVQAAADGSLNAPNSLENQISQSKNSGSPLAPQIRAYMEPRFGADFSSVRVHTDSQAVQMNRDLGAQAFTHGNHIYYGSGKSPGNNHLTAHELTHTIQQNESSQVQRATEFLQRKAGDNPDSSVLAGCIHPYVVRQIIQWLENRKAAQQRQYKTFVLFFLNQSDEVQERTIVNIVLNDKQKKQAQQKPKGEYIITEFNSDVKNKFKKDAWFGLKKNASEIDWDAFTEAARQAGANTDIWKNYDFDSVEASQSKEVLKNTALEVTGLSAFDKDLQTSDRFAGGASLAGNISIAVGSLTKAISDEVAKAALMPTGIVTGAMDVVTGGVNAYTNTKQANQSRELQNSEDKKIAEAARVNKRNQMALRTDNIGLAAQGAIAVTLTAVGLATMTFPIITAVGLMVLAGRKIYAYLKNQANKEKFADEVLQIQDIKDKQERYNKREHLLHSNGYASVDGLYKDFVNMVSADLYLRGVIRGEEEPVQLINSLGLKIDRKKAPPTPTEKVIASKYGV